MDILTGTVSAVESIDGSLSVSETISGDVGAIGAEHYDGDYIFTPSNVEQHVVTAGKLLRDDIVIEPIPHNYGRIEWNGTTLTIT